MPLHHHPDSRKVFPCVQTEPPVLQVVPIASDPVPEHQWQEPGSVPLASSPQEFLWIIGPPELSLLQPEQFQVSWSFLIGEMFQFLNHPQHSALECVHALRSPEPQVWPHQCCAEGKEPSLILLMQPCLCQGHVAGTPVSP